MKSQAVTMTFHGKTSEPLLERSRHLKAVEAALKRTQVVALLGARQVGKSTLARQVAANFRGPSRIYDLEHEEDRRRLREPADELAPLKGLVVLDEVQHAPELFRALRVLADRRPLPARFLVLGSASPALLRQTSESLAGRITEYELPPLGIDEVPPGRVGSLWARGGFPRSYVARGEAASSAWRRDFQKTFVQRDLPALGVGSSPAALGRFWTMLAHVHGGVLSWSELGRSLGVSDMTVRSYLDVLEQTYMVRVLRPWHENLGKRQVKAPKVYIRDSGLLHTLLDLPDLEAVKGHPKSGASWEGFCLEQVLQRTGADERQRYFWATHQGAELDLLVVKEGKRHGFELKLSSAPLATKSMHIALEDLKLDSLTVIHRGAHAYSLGGGIRALPLTQLWNEGP